MVFKSLVLQIIKSNNVLVDSVILVGLSIICCNWYIYVQLVIQEAVF
jgi:hypothetical protein